MGKYTEREVNIQNIDLGLERNSMDKMMNMKMNGVNGRPVPEQSGDVLLSPSPTPVPAAFESGLPLPSPGGTSTGSLSTTNNTNSNSYVSSDANSISSGSDLADSSKADSEVLLAQIKYQVEFYFSQQNLNRDAYMQEQMNEEGYIPIATIANFKQVKKLTSNIDLILQAIANSTICTLNESGNMIKASWKRPARTTIIIREADESVSEADILELLQGTDFKVVSTRSDVAQTWFVTMDTEEDAKNALLYMIGKTLKGQRIKARLKSETLPAPAPAPLMWTLPDGTKMPYPNAQSVSPQYYGGYQVAPPNIGYNMLGYPPNPIQSWNTSLAYPGYDQTAVPPNVDNSSSHLMNHHQVLNQDGSLKQPPQQQQQQPSHSHSQGGKGQRSSSRGGNMENPSRRRSNGMPGNHSSKPSHSHSASNSGSKKKKSASKRIKTPVFQAYDFPSLPGKMNMERIDIAQKETEKEKTVASAETATKDKEEQHKLIAAAPTGTTSSWAATVAKVQSPPHTLPSSANGSFSKSVGMSKAPGMKQGSLPGQNSPPKCQTKDPTVSKSLDGNASRGRTQVHNVKGRVAGVKVAHSLQQQHQAGLGSGTKSQRQQPKQPQQPTPVKQHEGSYTPRPKRGWEKPGLTPVAAKAMEVKAESPEDNDKTTTQLVAPPRTSPQATKIIGSPKISELPTSASANSNIVATGNVVEDQKPKDFADNSQVVGTAASAWGAKKSFADIIKSGADTSPSMKSPTPISATSAGQQNAKANNGGAANTTSPVSSSPARSESVRAVAPTNHQNIKPKKIGAGFGRQRGSSIDGDWRRKDLSKSSGK